jgi:signal recognition particle GTPase
MAKTEINTKELERFIRKSVFEIMGEFLSDRDFGLELKKSFIKKLKKSISQKKNKLYSLEDLKIK